MRTTDDDQPPTKGVPVADTTETELRDLIAQTWDQLRTPGTADTALPWDRVNPVVTEHVLKVTEQVIRTIHARG